MATHTMTNPSMEINNNAISYVPGSLSHNEGAGDTKVRIGTTGGGSTQVYFSEDVESQFSVVKFSLIPTETNIKLIREWRAANRINGSVINLSDGTYTQAYTEMALIASPEINTGPDGEIEIEFNGRGR